jgi:hypothetical protein
MVLTASTWTLSTINCDTNGRTHETIRTAGRLEWHSTNRYTTYADQNGREWPVIVDLLDHFTPSETILSTDPFEEH